MPLPLDLIDWEVWLYQAEPGARLVYHRGELARDRGRYTPDPEIAGWYRMEPVEPLHTLASAIYEAAEHGLVMLTQAPERGARLLPWRKFEYRATRTTKELP